MENSVKKRETYVETEIDDRKFIIESYDPMVGNYILLQIVNLILPFGIGDAISSAIPGSEPIVNNASNKRMMSKEEFIQFQTDILSTVFEKYPSGEKSPVVRENRTYGISDVTGSLCLQLLIRSVMFNYKDFFKDVPSLSSLISL